MRCVFDFKLKGENFTSKIKWAFAIILRPLSVVIKSLTFHILIFSSELLGQLKPIFADMMFVRSSIMIPHFVLIKANHGQDEQFLFVIINFFDGIDVCFMVFKATFNNISVI